MLGGTIVPEIDLGVLIGKRVQLLGTLLTPRSDQYKAELAQTFMQKAGPFLENGKIRPIIDRTFQFLSLIHISFNDNGKVTRRKVSKLFAPKSLLALIKEGFISSNALKIGIIMNGISIYVATNRKLKSVNNICFGPIPIKSKK